MAESAAETGVELTGREPRRRWCLRLGGIVQGVGFRPFVHRLAHRYALGGRVYNDAAGVVIEVEGPVADLTAFAAALVAEPPPAAQIGELSRRPVEPVGEITFIVEASAAAGPGRAGVAPDLALCADCHHELLDPSDRRYRYPFINCSNCGPRYTIIEKIPYDRPNTSMAAFTMCPACRAEYEDPSQRRFHAQPNACPLCGPRLSLLLATPAGDFQPLGGGASGTKSPADAESAMARQLLREGKVVAIKGIGGFHLVVAADNEQAVQTLRRRKGRGQKPLALMARDLATAKALVHLNPDEEAALTSPARPILLAVKKTGRGLAAVAPGNNRFGVMLPYAPLHHLLLGDDLPLLVMTSANRGGEPICIGNQEAQRRLAGIADAILLHDREILRGNDDSVLMVPDAAAAPIFLRRGRGHAPGILPRLHDGPPVLGVGGELKNTLCLAGPERVVLSQHLGDLQNLETYQVFCRTVADLTQLFALTPGMVACDLHPDYLASRWARQWAEEQGVPLVTVQHHHAHLAAALAEHRHDGPAIGLILDGTGYGSDGTIWGGEILLGDAASFSRFGHLETLLLPGGEAAVKEPWRTGLAYLEQAFAGDIPRLPWLAAPATGEFPRQQELLLAMLHKKINCPATSSCGRLFDAVAAIGGVCLRISYEAQAAIELMQLGGGLAGPDYDWGLEEEGEGIVLAIRPLVRDIARAVAAGEEIGRISRRFHYTLVQLFAAGVARAAAVSGLKTVVLAGGVMQNEIILRGLERELAAAGFKVLIPRSLPLNDGGIAYGQVAVAIARSAKT
ncbi:carbamoyltransferase HypF [Desulfurivibrio sp. D14AmB]|uniref:carbamoyltransferase HypF n=1 Tax=Desulfurivibrio sp. D14AmB TaxID=3374370 RepID=UPI00376F0079